MAIPTSKIKVKIDVLKVLKEHLFKTQKGAKHLTLTLHPTDKFGNDYFITQDCGKDDSGNWVKSPILGDGKIQEPFGAKPAAVPVDEPIPADDSVPF